MRPTYETERRHRVEYRRAYNGTLHDVTDPPVWLQRRVNAALVFIQRSPVTLVCSDAEGAHPVYGETAPCNGGYVITIIQEEA